MMDDSSVRFEYAEPETESGDAARPAENAGMTADALLRRNSARFPARLAYADPSNRPASGLGPTRQISFAQADAYAGALAARFMEFGLEPGDRIALQLPNIVELPLFIAAAWRARLVPVALPLMWRLNELHHALPQIDPAAIVTVGAFGRHNHSETIREAAAHHIAVRHVFGLGPDLADGVSPVDDWFAADADLAAAALAPPRGDDMAAMTWAACGRGPYPVPRTHRELLAVGRYAAEMLALTGDDVTLTTYPMTSIPALGGQLAAALHAGAAMVLHQPFSYDGFLAQLRDYAVTYTAVPGPVIDALEERGDFGEAAATLRRIGRVWPWPHQAGARDDVSGAPVPVFDIHNLGELALMIEPSPTPPGLQLGKLTAGQDDASEELLLETRVRGSVSGDGGKRKLSGALYLRGAMVPSDPGARAGALAQSLLRPDEHGFLDAHTHCTVDENLAGRFAGARDAALIYHGGIAIGGEELDADYASFPDVLDAAALPIADDLMGDRIFAAVVPRADRSPSLRNMKHFLAGKGVADYKMPDQLVIVKSIPRDSRGQVLRDQILSHI